MQIRDPRIQDVPKIHELINSFAEMDRMLFASMASIYENLQIFKVAELDGVVVGCCALKVLWKDLAEIKSLAVDTSHSGKGIGRALVIACMDKARALGLKKIFTLTLEPVFFEKVGFKRVEKAALPMKVWSDCTECPKQDHCDEIALECIL
ncbi:MAG: N-acetyltransferase [Planctomycetota bacterium]|jgi:amino-acid N-acetyltransferase